VVKESSKKPGKNFKIMDRRVLVKFFARGTILDVGCGNSALGL
jgi:tRNA1(Val) A37 N6-methylase TrmN6